jgi:AbrB family looped-hinge helix DNA binding protein
MVHSYTTVLTRKGQTTIPAELREELGLKQGDQIIWTKVNGDVRMIPAREVVRRTAGIFKDRVPPLPPGGIEQRMAEEKEAATRGWTERWERFAAENDE